jgi:uncharacterized protein
MKTKTEPAFTAYFNFHEKLNVFLPKAHRNSTFTYYFNGNPSIKDAIEANQVPHTEVGSIFVNNAPVTFKYHLKHDDTVAVHSVFSPISKKCSLQLRPPPFLQFIADVHCGTLARYLRLLGFDVLYDQVLDDPAIIKRGVAEHRIIITRDRKLLHAKVIEHGCCLHSTDPLTQLKEVIARYELSRYQHPLSRCCKCNGMLHIIAKKDIIDRLEPKTKRYYNDFRICENCETIYWKGSHFIRLDKVLQCTEGEGPKTG